MIKFKQVGNSGGDQLSIYELELDKEYSVEEFIQTILKENKQKHGFFGIYKPDYVIGEPVFKYRYKILYDFVPLKLRAKKVQQVQARGGCGIMNYMIKLK